MEPRRPSLYSVFGLNAQKCIFLVEQCDEHAHPIIATLVGGLIIIVLIIIIIALVLKIWKHTGIYVFIPTLPIQSSLTPDQMYYFCHLAHKEAQDPQDSQVITLNHRLMSIQVFLASSLGCM